MTKRTRKHVRRISLPVIKLKIREKLRRQRKNFPIDVSLNNRISFSVLRNKNNQVIIIENISYEILVGNKWEWVVRYDDHGGIGLIHRHVRLNLNSSQEVESNLNMPKQDNKTDELTWVCKEIKGSFLKFRMEILKNSKPDLF